MADIKEIIEEKIQEYAKQLQANSGIEIKYERKRDKVKVEMVYTGTKAVIYASSGNLLNLFKIIEEVVGNANAKQ